MFRLAHLSDVHLGPLPDLGYRDLVSKRVTGYVNWNRNRRKFLNEGVIGAIVADIKAAAPDHIAVTGDLVNLALDAEIELARQWLVMLGSPESVSVVPGNHDAYVPGALDKVCQSWSPFMAGDGREEAVDRNAFPYVRVRENIALIGATSARATAPFMANGFFREGQAERLGHILRETGEKGLFRIVMIHHPPVRSAVPSHKRLLGIGNFQDTVLANGAELVLHGHSHLPTTYWIPGPQGRIPVVGVAAAGQSVGSEKPPAQWNLLEIGGTPGDWSVRLVRRGLQDAGSPPIELSTTLLAGWPSVPEAVRN